MGVLRLSGHSVEAAKWFLEARERYPVGSESWAHATVDSFMDLLEPQCVEGLIVVKPEWWNDEGLKALSARVLRAAPNMAVVNIMRADVLSGRVVDAWEVGSRSKAELEEAAPRFDRAAALCNAPAEKDEIALIADSCRSQAEAM